jgi:hypothetical protein
MQNSRALAPVAASLAVLAVVTGTWALAGPGDRTPAAHRSPLPTVAPDAFVGGPPRTPASGRTHPALTVPNGVPIDRYSVTDPTHLLLSYTIGVTGCSGAIDRPVVRESARTVTVTLLRRPGRTSSGGCPSLSLMEATPVTLSGPLQGRQVLDGATGGTPVPRGPRPAP